MALGTHDPTLVPTATLEALSPREELRLWRPATLPGVELMTAVHSNRLWRVFHETYSICVLPTRQTCPIGSDIAEWRYRSETHVMHPGTVAFMEPGEVHANKRNHHSADFFVLFLDPAIFYSAAQELSTDARPHLRMAQTQSHVLRNAVNRFYAALADDRSPLEQETRLAACVRLLLDTGGERRPDPPPRAHPGVRRVRDYLQAHFRETLHLDHLAALASMSRYHLAHTFTRTYGLAPHAYQNEVRIAFARREVRRGTPPSEIDAGYFDQSHLTRHFKRATGMTPGQYAVPAPGGPPPFA